MFAIQYIPRGVGVPSTYDGNFMYLTTVVQLSGSVDVMFEVPYDDFYPFTLPIFPSTSSTPTSGPAIIIFPISNVQGPSANNFQFVRVNVYVSGPNMTFVLPSLTNMLPFTNILTTQPQSSDVEVRLKPNPLAVFTFGEEVMDVRELAKRFVKNLSFSNAETSSDSLNVPVSGAYPCPNSSMGYTTSLVTPTGVYWTFFQWATAMSFSWSGGVRHKIRFENMASNTPILISVIEVVGQACGLFVEPINFCSTTPDYGYSNGAYYYNSSFFPFAEFECQGKTIFRYKAGNNFFTNSASIGILTNCYRLSFVSGNYKFHDYLGAADDFDMNILTPPVLREVTVGLLQSDNPLFDSGNKKESMVSLPEQKQDATGNWLYRINGEPVSSPAQE